MNQTLEDSTVSIEAFRTETRAWIEANCPQGARGPGQIPFGSSKVAVNARRCGLAASDGVPRLDRADLAEGIWRCWA